MEERDIGQEIFYIRGRESRRENSREREMGVRERDMYIGREKLGLREIWRHVYIGSEMRVCDRDFAHVRGEETEDLKRELKKHGREEGRAFVCACGVMD